ncbi:unnamed protein product [Brassica oleracea]
MEMENKNQKRFVLVHGLCHGAWSWYKVKPILEAASHTVTAVNLAASGINTTRLEEIQTLEDYCKPLLDVLSSADEEKVVLVAHSMGGISAAFAADIFPHKISAIVFVTSFMPDTTNPPAYVFKNVILVAHSMGGIPAALAADIFPCNTAAIVFLTSSMPDTKNPPAYVFEKLIASIPPEEFLDTVFGTYGTCDRPLQTILFGPKFLAEKFYQLSPVEDLELAKLLVRVNPLVTNNLAGTRRFSEEGYGSIPRIYIICEEDNIIPKEYQRWIIRNIQPKEVIKIKDADHMPMISKPQELCACFLKIADMYP